MGRIIPLVLALVAVATQALAVPQNVKEIEECKNPKQSDPPHLFDVLVLTVQSRGGYCELHSCQKIPAGQKYPHPPLTIKSLTTRWSNGTEGPTSCTDPIFDMKKLEEIKSNLTYNWPSFDSNVIDEAFWKVQFKKYGSCFICQEVAPSEYALRYFFQVGLIRFSKYNISHYLDEAKIKQSYENPIPLQKLKDALRDNPSSIEPEFHCEGTRTGLDILREIRICFDAKSTQLLKCPSTEKQTCRTENVWYLGNSSLAHVPSTIMVMITMLLAYLVSKNQ